VVPALEKLYATWEKQCTLPEAKPFERALRALKAAMAKVDEYYKKTAESDVHIMAMCMLSSQILLLSLQIYSYNTQFYI
jgi:hypothetical protein